MRGNRTGAPVAQSRSNGRSVRASLGLRRFARVAGAQALPAGGAVLSFLTRRQRGEWCARFQATCSCPYCRRPEWKSGSRCGVLRIGCWVNYFPNIAKDDGKLAPPRQFKTHRLTPFFIGKRHQVSRPSDPNPKNHLFSVVAASDSKTLNSIAMLFPGSERTTLPYTVIVVPLYVSWTRTAARVASGFAVTT